MSFTAVIVGITEAAMALMRQEFQRRGHPGTTFRAFEKVEWVSAEQEAWLIEQAYEGGCGPSNGRAGPGTMRSWQKRTSPGWRSLC